MLSTPVGTLQRETNSDRQARGPCWVSRVVLPAPVETDVLNIILDAVRSLGNGSERYMVPTIENVHAQWTGYRAGVGNDEPEPIMSESEKFDKLQKEVTSPVNVLYLHGGSHYLLGPAARRATTSILSQLTGGRCLSIQYRLAPQNPFPAALLDCLVAYLTLLYPSQGSFHGPVPAREVVFAGDSSGAGLAMSIIQVILHARKQQKTTEPILLFHGRKVGLPMPAGLAFQSPSFDTQLNTLPSWAANYEYDTVPPEPPGYDPEFPTDEVWPSNPARGNYYCETSMLYHPLVCAMGARNWVGCPPIYMAIGSKERIVDAAKFVAQNVAKQGIVVLWDEYELMPHNWPMGFPSHPNSEKCYHSWAKACLLFVNSSETHTSGTITSLENSQARQVEVTKLTNLTTDEVARLMKSKQNSIQPFTGNTVPKSQL
ncbi:MAG: hypothetical protein Q9204_002199 [Flavoplaca sp. TL-2023a]